MTIYFYSMFSFKKQFKLEINQTGDKNTLPSNMAPWHSGHHQRRKATCTFSTNLLPRKQVTKLKEKIHDLFSEADCMSSFERQLPIFKKENQRPRNVESLREQAMLCPQFTEVASTLPLSKHTPQLTCSSSRRSRKTESRGFSASLGFLFQRFPCHIEFIFTKLLCYFLCYAVKFLLKGPFH